MRPELAACLLQAPRSGQGDDASSPQRAAARRAAAAGRASAPRWARLSGGRRAGRSRRRTPSLGSEAPPTFARTHAKAKHLLPRSQAATTREHRASRWRARGAHAPPSPRRAGSIAARAAPRDSDAIRHYLARGSSHLSTNPRCDARRISDRHRLRATLHRMSVASQDGRRTPAQLTRLTA